MADPKEPVPQYCGIYTSMTPGPAAADGGYEKYSGSQSPPRRTIQKNEVSPPSGLSNSKSLTYHVRRGGRGHNCIAPQFCGVNFLRSDNPS